MPLDTEPITERITISTRSWKLCLQFRQHSLGFPSIDMMSMWKIQSLSPFRILASRGSRWQGRRWQARWGWTACCRGRAQPSGQSSGTWELWSCTFEHKGRKARKMNGEHTFTRHSGHYHEVGSKSEGWELYLAMIKHKAEKEQLVMYTTAMISICKKVCNLRFAIIIMGLRIARIADEKSLFIHDWKVWSAVSAW